MKTNYTTELDNQLVGFSVRCREARWLGPLFHVGVSQEILRDVKLEQRRQADDAYSAEQADLEAAKIIRQVMVDGRVTKSELPQLTKALRHVHNSARLDRRI